MRCSRRKSVVMVERQLTKVEPVGGSRAEVVRSQGGADWSMGRGGTTASEEQGGARDSSCLGRDGDQKPQGWADGGAEWLKGASGVEGMAGFIGTCRRGRQAL